MTALGYDLATVRVLWWRDLARFFRQPSRLAGALGQPILFWLIIGTGMASTFRMPGADAAVGYLQFFYPGVVLMVVLFAAIFTTVSVIEDRHAGFLQAVLAGPGSRAALVLGKTLGSASVALTQAGIARLAETTPVHVRGISQLFVAQLDDQELALLERALNKIIVDCSFG